ncbi:nucleotide-binding protein [Patescibacteria group bacterium]|nr:nucleotide-binding protein [Patescibacteria group bacterium]
MTLEERTADVVAMIDAQYAALEKLVRRAQTDGDYRSGFERLKRWKSRTASLLDTNIHPNEGERLRNKRKGSSRMNDPIGNLADEADMYAGLLRALKEDIEDHPSDVLSSPVHSEEPAHFEAPSAGSNVVFIVHGHDEHNLLRLKEMLREKWNLESIVLVRKPGKGRTLIEKFEDEAKAASFALVLLTPDDFIASEQEDYAQARPNVIFELGWFYGQLGRDRVCILLRKGTKIHSDLDGISRIEFKESVEEVATQVESELVAGKMLSES